MKLKRVILISSFVVMCVSAAPAQVSQIGVESLYQGITSADAAITAQMFALNGVPRVNHNGRVTSLNALRTMQTAK